MFVSLFVFVCVWAFACAVWCVQCVSGMCASVAAGNDQSSGYSKYKNKKIFPLYLLPI